MSVEQPLNEVDSELRRLLNPEPSPEFVARVRQHVLRQQMSRDPWTTGWLLAASAALVAISAGALSLLTPPVPDAKPHVSVSSRSDIVLPREPGLTTRADPAKARKPVARQPARVRTITPRAEVLFDNRQRIAIERLMELVRTGTVIELPDTPEQAPLAVSPLSVSPIIVESPTVPRTSERN
jgi:hypothetical protein